MRRIGVVAALALQILFLAPLALAQSSGDQLPCKDPCPGHKYEATVNSTTGQIDALSGYDATDPESGHLVPGPGEVLVAIPSDQVAALEMAFVEGNVSAYSVNLKTDKLIRGSKVVAKVGVSRSELLSSKLIAVMAAGLLVLGLLGVVGVGFRRAARQTGH